MKSKMFSATAAVLSVLIVAGLVYLKIWGGEPQLETFREIRSDYEILAELALDTYEEISPEKEYVVFDVYDDALRYEDYEVPLNEKQQKAVELVNEEFDYLRVCQDAVFFHEDETGYYGLVYSKHPITALYKNEIPQRGRDYHRLSSYWYEWGVFGL